VTRSVAKQAMTRTRLATVAFLFCTVLFQSIAAPMVRGRSERIAAFETELLASICSEHGREAPGKPDRDHCPDMPCCLHSLRAELVSGICALATLASVPVAVWTAERTIWAIAIETPRIRVASSPQRARAPPASLLA
jgi:hypothetical protein